MWDKKDVMNIIVKNKITPGCSFYAYNLDLCLERIKQIKEYFSDWNVLYSVKSNPHPQIVSRIIECNVGIDAASKNEVVLAKSLGCPAKSIFYSSPGKTNQDLRYCYNCCNIVADSINEIKRIAKLAEENNCIIRIGIRINIENSAIIGNAYEVMSGENSQFGLTKSDIPLIKDICKNNPIDIIGIHVYFGSQILDERIIISNFNLISNYAVELSKQFELEYVNFGGGFGIPYLDSDKNIDLSLIKDSLTVSEDLRILKAKKIQLNLELGRYLIGEAGIFCASVEDIKRIQNKKFVILSAGMNAFIRPVFTKQYHKVSSCRDTTKKEIVTIAGNLCTPIDRFYENYTIDEIEIGDWVWFENAGAYGFSMSMLNFISHTKPLELFL